jgi:hypothetical protein
MSYNTLVNNIPITPKSLKEVKSTGLKDLKALCKDAGINIGGVGREALEILLCIELGIRTSGAGTPPARKVLWVTMKSTIVHVYVVIDFCDTK